MEAAKEADLDLARFKKDLADQDGLLANYQNQGDEFFHMPLGFYNVILMDEQNRTVILEHAFEPSMVDEALSYLSRGQLTKNTPTDVVGYLRAHGLAPLREIERAFGFSPEEAKRELGKLEKAGKARSIPLAGAQHWSVG